VSDSPGSHPHFRLNLEQQQKRAKDLLRAARAGDATAIAKFRSHPPKLAEAQYLIARELRFENWAALKHHIAAMTRERARIERGAAALDREGARIEPSPAALARDGVPIEPGTAALAREPSETAPSLDLALDGDLRTLHIRCGSDLRKPLQSAGFRGDFYEHSYPYLIAPVREGPGCLEERAHFLVSHYGEDAERPLVYEAVLDGLRRDEQRLHESFEYERVIIWSEADCYDQLVLLRLLAHYAANQRPPRLELINVRDFPGSRRFIGLGQLPPEALRLLWQERQPATLAQLSIGLAGWKALASADPRALAAIMRGGTPDLPLLAPALHRHLRELPSIENGLGFTQHMALTMLAEQPHSLNLMFVRMTAIIDPLPGQGDSQMRDRVLAMAQAREPLFTQQPGLDREGRSRLPWTDVFTITELGRAVLAGDVDFQSLAPPPRWVGGVRISREDPDWRWDESRRQAMLAPRSAR
jgi:uncharacterized protein DUF1835